MAGKQSGFSGFIIKIAVAAIALSIAVMIVTTATVNGFQNEISRKIFNFWGHVRISGYDMNNSIEDLTPISTQTSLYNALDSLPGVRHVQMYANKAGIVKTDTDIEGLIIKGIGADFDGPSFGHYMLEGSLPDYAGEKRSNDIVVSQTTAQRLGLKVNDNMIIYFVQEKPLARKLNISGIYNTGLEEYDEKYALADIRHIQRLNKWEADEAGGLEVFLTNNDHDYIDEMANKIHYELTGHELYTESIKEANPNIFEWLQLQDMNESVIIGLILLVAIINMTTALLILILDRTNMIGILKALGASNFTVREIFLYNAAYIIGMGLLWGEPYWHRHLFFAKAFRFYKTARRIVLYKTLRP